MSFGREGTKFPRQLIHVHVNKQVMEAYFLQESTDTSSLRKHQLHKGLKLHYTQKCTFAVL